MSFFFMKTVDERCAHGRKQKQIFDEVQMRLNINHKHNPRIN